ncbi:MAG: lysophospholipid acyltransferase family protein [Terriglobia bacterium]
MTATSPTQTFGAGSAAGAPPAYRLMRGLLRRWLGAFFGKIRLLHAGTFSESGAALLIVRHPPGFLDALILVGAVTRQICCLVPRQLLQGPARAFVAHSLRMIPYDPSGANWESVLAASCERLADGTALVIFSDPRAAGPSHSSSPTLRAASIAVEAESRHPGELGITFYSVDLFLPVASLQSAELLIYVDAPVPAIEYRRRGGKPEDRALALATALDEAGRQNAFRLPEDELRHFQTDLEEVLRRDLDDDWKTRPKWKQSADDLRLSRFAVELVEQLNGFNPGRLVALRESLHLYHEAERMSSLHRCEADVASWFPSPWRRLAVCCETLIAAPIAAYAFLNHMPAGIVLLATRLFKKSAGPTPPGKWLARAFVVLASYAAQIGICHHFLGRVAAGYYAVSLPSSGLYLWRYTWLLRHRTRLLYHAARTGQQRAKLRRMRKEFLREFDAARDAYAEMIGLPR